MTPRRSLMLGCVLALFGVVLPRAAADPPFQLPAPTGNAHVGTTRWVVVDQSRAEAFDPARRREIEVVAWYPTSASGGPRRAAHAAASVPRLTDAELGGTRTVGRRSVHRGRSASRGPRRQRRRRAVVACRSQTRRVLRPFDGRRRVRGVLPAPGRVP